VSSSASQPLESDALAAFLRAEAAYLEAIQELKVLERARDEALLAASQEIPIPELSAATGLSKDRARRIINRASRATRSWGFARV
jgi:hypothetical protein